MSAVVRRTIDAPLQQVWDVVSDFSGYGRWIPLTKMVVDAGATRVGWGFGGRTGLGPVAFLDSMLVTVWEPPGAPGAPEGASARFAIRKTGRLLAGWAEVEAVTRADGRTDLTWTEEIVPRPQALGRLLAPLADPVTSRLFGRAVDAMGRVAETAARRPR